jgi:hypothetical protein
MREAVGDCLNRSWNPGLYGNEFEAISTWVLAETAFGEENQSPPDRMWIEGLDGRLIS